MIEFIDKTSEQSGTFLNRENMMGIQGFVSKRITFGDGYISEINARNGEDGESFTTTFNPDGTITETLVGEKTIQKTTTFNADGSITEVIS